MPSPDPRLLLAAEAASTLAEARWRAVFDSAVDGIIVMNARGVIEAFNRGAERLFGYTEAEVLGRPVTLLMPPPYCDEHAAYVSRYLETGERKIIGIGREVTALKRGGATFPVRLAVGEVRVGGEVHFTGIIHDLTERVQLERTLREQTALARLGEMAAVIAHEVKNPLTAVRGVMQIVGGRLPAESADKPILNEAIRRLDSLNELISDLLLFARPPRPHLIVLDITAQLRLVAELLQKDPAFRDITIDVSGDGTAIRGDMEQLTIVLQNLILNAAQAMQGRGVIRVEVSTAAGMQRVRVIDQGPGIPPEVREKLFQPFFTTKARGTGLGLLIARRLAEAHGGTVSFDCPPSGGTIATVELPLQGLSLIHI